MSNEHLLSISLVRHEEKVELTKADGQARTHTVREMVGTDRDSYLNELTRLIGTEEDRKKSPDYRGVLSVLICRCLYDDADKLVPKTDIDSMPVTAQKKLFDLCQRVNGFGGVGEGKND